MSVGCVSFWISGPLPSSQGCGLHWAQSGCGTEAWLSQRLSTGGYSAGPSWPLSGFPTTWQLPFQGQQETCPLYYHHKCDLHHLYCTLLARASCGYCLHSRGQDYSKDDSLGVTLEYVFYRSWTFANMPLFPGCCFSEIWGIGLNYNKMETSVGTRGRGTGGSGRRRRNRKRGTLSPMALGSFLLDRCTTAPHHGGKVDL